MQPLTKYKQLQYNNVIKGLNQVTINDTTPNITLKISDILSSVLHNNNIKYTHMNYNYHSIEVYDTTTTLLTINILHIDYVLNKIKVSFKYQLDNDTIHAVKTILIIKE